MAIKTETISIRISPEEKEQIKMFAAAADMSVSSYAYEQLWRGIGEWKRKDRVEAFAESLYEAIMNKEKSQA